MKATVTQGDNHAVQCIWLLHESPKAVIVSISTVAKFANVRSFNSVTIHLDGCEIKFSELPFKNGHMIFMPDRDTLQVCMYSDELHETLLVPLATNDNCLFSL